MAQRPAGLRIEVPKPADDKPRIGRVAVITVVGFAIGIAWPRLAGVKLVPNAPTDEAAEEAPAGSAAAGAASGAPQKPPSMSKAAPVGSAAGDEPSPTPAESSDRMKLSEAKVTSCRDAKGGRANDCDAIEFDATARPKLLALADCGAAKQTQGTLSIGFELDFGAGKVTDVVKGKSTNLADATADAMLECAKKEFATVSLAGIEHKHAKYTVFYIAELLPPGAKPEPAAGESAVTPASGTATVTWEVAIIRDTPKEGEVVARILRGTRVGVTGRNGDWYRIKYDAKGSEGWVFRTAIGM